MSSSDEQEFTTYSIGKYVPANNQWEAQDTHDKVSGVFVNHTHESGNDWAYNHNRLLTPGSSTITYKFIVPPNLVEAEGAKITVKVNNFAPWNMSACNINVDFNGECMIEGADVLGEHEGRTTHDFEVEKDKLENDGENSVKIKFNSGAGVLFLGFCEVEITGPAP